eukprot:PhF_6_TR457/c0_g1_i1/m.183
MSISHWRPDSSSDQCSGCRIKFTFFNRRHHCRECGNLVCSKCSPNRLHVPQHGFTTQLVRVCMRCSMQRILNEHEERTRAAQLEQDRLLALQLRAEEARLRREPCREFWTTGRCRNGDRCPFVHDEVASPTTASATAAVSRPPPHDASSLSRLPSFDWGAGGGGGGSGSTAECPICVMDIQQGDRMLTLPCFHMLHKQCVMEWLVKNKHCPTCRAPINLAEM